MNVIALKYHSDRNSSKESEHAKKVQAIQVANEVLTDPQMRAQYDAERFRSGTINPDTNDARPSLFRSGTSMLNPQDHDPNHLNPLQSAPSPYPKYIRRVSQLNPRPKRAVETARRDSFGPRFKRLINPNHWHRRLARSPRDTPSLFASKGTRDEEQVIIREGERELRPRSSPEKEEECIMRGAEVLGKVYDDSTSTSSLCGAVFSSCFIVSQDKEPTSPKPIPVLPSGPNTNSHHRYVDCGELHYSLAL